MNILAIDTTKKICSIALSVNDRILSKCFFNAKPHIRDILSIIDNLIKKTKIKLHSIDVLACNHGPGNFLSTKIGVSIIQGLSFGLDIPTIFISSLVILAEGAWRKTKIDQVISVIDACTKDKRVYWGAYKRQSEGKWKKSQEMVSTPLSFTKFIQTFQGDWAIAGTGWKRSYIMSISRKIQGIHLIDSKLLIPNINDIIVMSSILFYKKKILSKKYIQPNYLHRI